MSFKDLLTDQMRSEEVADLINTFEKRRSVRVQNIFTMSNAKIQAILNPEQIQGRNEAIRKLGAPKRQWLQINHAAKSLSSRKNSPTL